MHDVTIVCATRNGGDAVRLTFESLRRTTVAPLRVLVADNGSVDGTREMLGGLDWIELHRRRPGRHVPGHGATLDWLVRKVTTRPRVDARLRCRVPAARLAGGVVRGTRPFRRDCGRRARAGGRRVPGPPVARLLLLDTERLRALRCSFRSYVRIDDPDEALRWRRRPASGERVRQGELATYRSAAFYTTGARVFERLHESGSRWLATPAATRRKYRHLGHMSWAGADDELSERHRQNELHVRAALACVDQGT